MSEQLDLFLSDNGVLTINRAFNYYWEYHMRFLPSAVSFMGNRKALSKTIGHLPFSSLSKTQIQSLHIPRRSHYPAALKHDLVLLTMLYNKIRDWKDDNFIADGLDFSKIQMPYQNPTSRIKRPKTYSRQVIFDPREISRIVEHSNTSLVERIFFSIDTAQSGIDLRNLRTSQYDPRRNGFSFIRHKTGLREFLPASNRCRDIALRAIKEGREFILDWTNHRSEWEKAKKKAGVNKQWRDIRKTSINRVHYKSGRIDIAQKIAIHASSRTTEEHYLIDGNENLKPWIKDLETTFSVGNVYNLRRENRV